jgi:hypothetical protein
LSISNQLDSMINWFMVHMWSSKLKNSHNYVQKTIVEMM